MYLRLRLRENLIQLLQRRTDFVLYATDLIDYAVSKMNSQERKRERENAKMRAKWREKREKEKGREKEEKRGGMDA